MYYGRGMGRGTGRGYGWGMGFGFRESSPPWPYVGIGRGGLPRCWTFGGYGYGGPAVGYVPSRAPFYPGAWPLGRAPYAAPYSSQEEVRFLKNQAEMLREEIQAIDARLQELEREKSSGGA